MPRRGASHDETRGDARRDGCARMPEPDGGGGHPQADLDPEASAPVPPAVLKGCMPAAFLAMRFEAPAVETSFTVEVTLVPPR